MAIEWHPEEPDGRIINDLREWQTATDRLENPIHAGFYRLLLFTGLRKTEAFTLERKNVHKDRLHLPMTKNGRSFDLPIVDAHHAILEPVHGLTGSGFPRRRDPTRAISRRQKACPGLPMRIVACSPRSPWRPGS
jgi:integrase